MTNPQRTTESAAAPADRLPCGHLHVSEQDVRELGPCGAAALHHAQAFGFEMLPIVAFRSTPPLIKGWQHLATSDPAQIRKWCREFPGCNWGHRTGRGRLVADLDVKHGDNGPAALVAFMAERGLSLPPVPFATSPTGGRHLLMRISEEVPSRSSSTRIIPGVDLLADGGHYAVMPMSQRRITTPARPGQPKENMTVAYRWADGSCPCQAPRAPAWLTEAMRTMPSIGYPAGHPGSTGNWSGDLPPTEELLAHGLPVGGRNGAMYRLACRLWREHGMAGAAEVFEVCRRVFDATDTSAGGEDGESFTWAEAGGRIESARKYIAGQIAEETSMMRSYLGRTAR